MANEFSEGGPNSGNWNHAGRKGKVGGSQPGGGALAVDTVTPQSVGNQGMMRDTGEVRTVIDAQGRTIKAYRQEPTETYAQWRARKDAENKALEAQAKQEKEDAKKARSTEFNGFLDDMTPARAARAEDALRQRLRYEGQFLTKRDIVHLYVKDNARVRDHPREGRILQRPDGIFLNQRQLGKTAIDYADYLVDIGYKEAIMGENDTAQDELEQQELELEQEGADDAPEASGDAAESDDGMDAISQDAGESQDTGLLEVYDADDAESLPANVQKLTPERQRRWVAIWNERYRACMAEDGAEDGQCETEAFRLANGTIREAGIFERVDEVQAAAISLMADLDTLRQSDELTEDMAEALSELARDMQHTFDMLAGEAWSGNGQVADASSDEELDEAVTKTIDGEQYPAGDFLVVEDPDMVDTWHLQVRRHGKPDHGLMGAAKAALVSEGGHRGNKYQGPQKQQAIAKLKKLYSDEGMLFEQSLDELLATPNLLEALLTLVDMVRERKDGEGDAQDMQEGESLSEGQETTETIVEQLAESSAGASIINQDPGGPLVMEVQLIRPGFGNRVDGHYYPPDMLRRDAYRFIGAKMHESEHNPTDKRNDTWVSTVTGIRGFTPEGAPLAEVVVHHPEFAKRVRNLAQTDLLEKLECSILAKGKAREGDVGGKQAKIVEAIVEGQGVDWVNRAGAGGKAMRILNEADRSDTVEKDKASEGAGVQENAAEDVSELTTDDAQETIAEKAEDTQTGEPQESDAQTGEVAEAAATEVVFLSESEVLAGLSEMQANPVIKAKVAKGQYATLAEAQAALTTELEYVQAITHSGSVKDMGETRQTRPEKVTTEVLAEVEKRKEEVNAKWLGVYRAGEAGNIREVRPARAR